MQVITGKFRGRTLISPDCARPTLQRLKTSLFSMIQGYITESSEVLDLFSGSGALGMECISRGAKHVFFVDNNLDAIKCIKTNLKGVDSSNFTILNSDYLTALKHFQNKIKFNITFIDPPYASGASISSIEIMERYDLIAENGIVVLELDASKHFDFNFKTLELIKDKNYGTTRIVIFKKLVNN